VIGKVNDDGVENPYSVTFVFKAGMESEREVPVKKAKGMHDDSNNVVYSYNATDTYRVRLLIKKKIVSFTNKILKLSYK